MRALRGQGAVPWCPERSLDTLIRAVSAAVLPVLVGFTSLQGVNILVGVTGEYSCRCHGKRVISAPSKPLKLKLAGHIL